MRGPKADRRRAMEFVRSLSALPQGSWDGEQSWPDLPGAAPWRSAIESSASDADAPLPN